MSTLSERDARQVCEKIVECLRALGGSPQAIRVCEIPDALAFTAILRDRMVTVLASPGTFTYNRIAAELLALSLGVAPMIEKES